MVAMCRVLVLCLVTVMICVVKTSPVDMSQKWIEECLKKNPGSSAEWNVDPTNTTTADKCYKECMLEKKGVLKNGKIDKKPILYEAEETAKVLNRESKMLDLKIWKMGINNCVDAKVPPGMCSKGSQLWYCVYSSMQKSFIKKNGESSKQK